MQGFRRLCQESAIDTLEKYVNSIRNGTINTVIGKDSDDKTTEQEGNNTNGKNNVDEKSKSSSSHRAYKPTDVSPVNEYLTSPKDKVLKEDLPPTWTLPPCNPVSKSFGSSTNPNQFYLSHIWAHVFDPMSPYRHLMPAKHECNAMSVNEPLQQWMHRH